MGVHAYLTEWALLNCGAVLGYVQFVEDLALMEFVMDGDRLMVSAPRSHANIMQ